VSINPVLEFVIYSRRGCHLCEEMLEEIEPLCRGKASLVVRDVDENAEWAERYGIYVPVLYVDETEICRYQLDRSKVIELLGAS
jgi:hypothetical protein